jgi:Peptidase inhibitor I78 family
MSWKLIMAGLSLAALFGCSSPRPPSAGAGPGGVSGGACNAQGAQFAVGKAPGASVVEQARQRSGAYMARVLRPKQAVTLEFNAQRLNLELDDAGVITRARCG